VGALVLAAVLPPTDAAGAMTWARRMREACARVQVDGDRGPARTTVSAGVATWPDDGGDATALLRVADLALSEAKASGRNAVRPARREAPDDDD